MIDPRAAIDPAAKLADDVSVGPFTLIGPDVEIGAGTWIGPHTVIKGPTRIGRDNRIYQFNSIGEDPQDKKYGGEPTLLEIGDRNTIREFCTFNRGTAQDAGLTRIGNDNWIMAYVHVAHDCIIGDDNIFANNASLAGHVMVGSHTVLGGYALVFQFCRVGDFSLLTFAAGVHRDVPPFFIADGYRAEPRGVNAIGLERRGFSEQDIKAIKQAYKILYKSDLRLEQAIERLQALQSDSRYINSLIEFLQGGKRSIIR